MKRIGAEAGNRTGGAQFEARHGGNKLREKDVRLPGPGGEAAPPNCVQSDHRTILPVVEGPRNDGRLLGSDTGTC